MKIKKAFYSVFVYFLIGVMIYTNIGEVSATTVESNLKTSIVSTGENIYANTQFKITSSESNKINTKVDTYTFTGISDPNETLTINDKKIERNMDGSFSEKVSLKQGENTFVFFHKNKTFTYIIDYEYALVESYSPSKLEKYEGGKTISINVMARKNSKVTATFRNKKVRLKAKSGASGTFIKYSAKIKLPKSFGVDVNYGKVKFTVTNELRTETFTSANIICKKNTSKKVKYSKKDPKYNLSGGRYLDVGKGKIAQIVGYEAETFNANSTNDWSRPTNNYLPKGTVDYCSNKYVYFRDNTTTKKYAVLRCGLQVYTARKNTPIKDSPTKVTKVYKGTLPDHNEIGVASFKNGTSHTTLTLDTMWRAPFYFRIPQTYMNPSNKDYRITAATYKYIDITFCYASVFTGEIKIPKNNPIFKSAKIIKNKSDYKLRLYLKKKGGFYGWIADFNSKGQLVFKFLNPAKITKAKNKYGYDLTGVRILIDVGHGGIDPGAVSFSKTHTEAYRNLYLSNLIKKELESIGATVYMTRTSNVISSTDDKLKMLRKVKPDYCIAIHHNSSVSSTVNGFDAYYSQPISMKATKYIRSYTAKTKIYKRTGIGWHHYYTARECVCPVVLTENGFMSNKYDYKNAIKSKVNQRKAKAITKGIVQYFSSIQ